MTYNAIISTEDVSDESGVITEPVTLQEIKDYIRLEGFQDADESSTDNISDFTSDDDLLEELITTGRQLMEEKGNVSIVSHTWSVVMQSMGVKQLMAYSPVQSITSVVDCEGEEVDEDNYRVIGLNGWTYITLPCGEYTVTYEAGFERIPSSYKTDLKRLVYYMYENRGEDDKINAFASQLVKSYSRKLPII